MKRHTWLCLAVSTLLFSVLLATAPARADDLADEADLQFRLGAERYTAGDYRGALEHFLASNRLVANRNVVFNIARAYEKLKRYPEAFRYYDAALAAETDADAKSRIEAALAEIRPFVAVVDVRTEPPGATLYIDRKNLGARGESPRKLGLPKGQYKIIAELAGHHPAERALEPIDVGSTTEVVIQLEPILGRVRLEGPARGAAITVGDDREPRCNLPCSLSLAPGVHTLHLALPGHKPAEVPVQVVASAETVLRPQLDVITGTLLVTTDEPGALIEVDGRSRGFTPAILTLSIGEHELQLSARGFRAWTSTVMVMADRQGTVEVALAQAEEVEAASRRAESVEDAPSSVTLIPREELIAFGYPTIADALRGVRGVYVWDDRSYVSVGVRGLGVLGGYTNRELVLLDGHPTNDDWIGSAYVGFDGRTDLADIERIEVVRGPGSVLYGTNAFSGVTNLVTRYRGEEPATEVGVSAAGPGVMRGRARTQQRLGDDAGIWASAAGAHGSGRDFYFPELAGADSEGYSRGADGFDAGSVQGRLWWDWATLQWFGHSHEKQLPTGEYDTLLGDPRTRQTDSRAFVEARAEPTLSPQVQLLSRVHWNLYRFRGDYAREPDDGGVEHDRYDSQWAGAEQRLVLTPVEPLRITLGGEGQLHYKVDQRARDDEGYYLDDSGDDERTFEVGAVYGLVDVMPGPTLHLQAGLRLDAYSTFGSSLNPRAAVIVKPYDGGNTKLLGGTAFRAPSIYELYYNDGGFTQVESPDLSPERMISLEIEHTHRFSPTVIGLVSLYANYVKNLIISRGAGDEDDPLQYANSSSPLVSVGAELLARREWRRGLMLEASYSVQHSRYLASDSLSDLFSLKMDPATRDVANSPAHLASVKLAAPLFSRGLTGATRLSLEGPRADRYEFRGEPAQRSTDLAVLWDVVLSGRDERLELGYSFGVYNLADFRYSLPVSAEFTQRAIRQNGRTFLASVDVAF